MPKSLNGGLSVGRLALTEFSLRAVHGNTRDGQKVNGLFYNSRD